MFLLLASKRSLGLFLFKQYFTDTELQRYPCFVLTTVSYFIAIPCSHSSRDPVRNAAGQQRNLLDSIII